MPTSYFQSFNFLSEVNQILDSFVYIFRDILVSPSIMYVNICNLYFLFSPLVVSDSYFCALCFYIYLLKNLVYLSIYTVYTYVYTYINIYSIYTHIQIHIYLYIYTHIYRYVYLSCNIYIVFHYIPAPRFNQLRTDGHANW